jgi:hypothetical protein
MNPLVYRIVGTQFGKRQTLVLKFGRKAYYEDEQTAQRALSQLRSEYPDAMIQYTAGDWRTVDVGT